MSSYVLCPKDPNIRKKNSKRVIKCVKCKAFIMSNDGKFHTFRVEYVQLKLCFRNNPFYF